MKYKSLINEFAISEKNTGSITFQLILLSERIDVLMEHLKQFKKDLHSKRGLILMVNKRKKLLKYIKINNEKQYQLVISALNLRR